MNSSLLSFILQKIIKPSKKNAKALNQQYQRSVMPNQNLEMIN